MHLTQVLMRRAGWIALACLVGALFLAGWRAQSDVHRESRGAAHAALLMRHLAHLQAAPPEAIEQAIRDVRDAVADGELRHLRFRLEDDRGHVLIAPSLGSDDDGDTWLIDLLQPMTEPISTTWPLLRADGRAFQVTLIGNPSSERQEAQANILAMAALLLLYSVTLLAGVYWAVRHAFAPIRNILGAIGHWQKQEFKPRIGPMPVRELDRIGQALNNLAEDLDHATEQRRLLSLKVLNLQEDERARLARELHDEFAQAITAVRADAAYLARRLVDPDLQEVARGLGQRCGDMQRGMRFLLGQLRPRPDQRGQQSLPLGALIEDLVSHWQNLPDQGIRFDCQIDPDSARLPQPLALTLFRLTQEALTNAARHAGPCTVRLSLSAQAEVVWSVSDDGNGVANLDQALQQGNGLAGMRERVWAHGGRIDMNSQIGAGLSLFARFPRPLELGENP